MIQFDNTVTTWISLDGSDKIVAVLGVSSWRWQDEPKPRLSIFYLFFFLLLPFLVAKQTRGTNCRCEWGTEQKLDHAACSSQWFGFGALEHLVKVSLNRSFGGKFSPHGAINHFVASYCGRQVKVERGTRGKIHQNRGAGAFKRFQTDFPFHGMTFLWDVYVQFLLPESIPWVELTTGRADQQSSCSLLLTTS